MKAKRLVISISILIALAYVASPFAADTALKYDSKGKRDPFIPLIGSGKAVSVELEDILSIDDVELEGIAIGTQGKRVAVINGQILKENERRGNLIVKNITDRTVTLLIEGKEYNINLPEEGGGKI